MTAVVVNTVEESYSASNAPAALSIEAALRAATAGTAAQWIGPRARITRRGGVTDNFLHPFTSQNVTSVAWLLQIPDGATAAALVTTLRQRLDARLQELSTDFAPVRMTAYATAINGPVAWWQSGEASITRTRDEFPALTTDANENPVGPDAGTHPTTPGEVLGGAIQPATDLLKPLAWLLGIGTALYLGAPLVGIVRERQRIRRKYL